MKSYLLYLIATCQFLLTAGATAAGTQYISNQLQIGLHEEKNLDSPIVKILSTGTALEIIKTEAKLSYVRGPQGASGWIDNSYLVKNDPDSGQRSTQDQTADLEKKLAAATARINSLQNSSVLNSRQSEYSDLEQLLKTEKLKAGQLEASLADLRKRVGQNNDNKSLYEQINQLQADKKNLEIELAISKDEGGASNAARSSVVGLQKNWRNLLIYLTITLILGIGAGVYLMDLLNRRRHGGFRV